MNDKKRSATSPIQSERSKDSKNDAGSPSSSSWASVVGGGQEVANMGGATRRPRTNSISSTMSTLSTAVWKEETEGPMRICFTVDILTRDGEPFKGSIAPKEALTKIFVKALGFKPEELHGITPGYKVNPTVLFRMKNHSILTRSCRGSPGLNTRRGLNVRMAHQQRSESGVESKASESKILQTG